MEEKVNNTASGNNSQAVPEKKKPEGFVSEIKNDKFILRSAIPPRFNWRGNSYVTSKLTEAQLLQLAEDKAFPHLELKSSNG